jgi:hypothetical protein
MQAWDIIWFRWLFIMVVSGIGLVVVCYLGFYLPNQHARQSEKPDPDRQEWPAGIEESSTGIPALLWFIIVGLVVFSLTYFIWVLQSHQPV